MKFLKLFYILTIITSLSVCSIARADTCYDPNYDRYYYCNGDEWIAPVAAGLLFTAILLNSQGGHHHHGDHHHDGDHGRWHH